MVHQITFELDHRILLFVGGLILPSCLFAGGLPALQAARVTAGTVLKDDSRSSTSGRLGRFAGGLVIAELAVSCGLLIAAGLMIKSVVQLTTVPMPFAVDDILTARVDLPREGYPDSAASIRFFEQLLPKLAAVPGVQSATLSDGLPAAGNGSIPVQLEGSQMKRIRPNRTEPWMTIVGVVPDLLMQGIGNNNASPVGYYIPIAQSDVANGVRIAVRTRGEATAITPLVRSAVAALDPDLAIYEVSSLRRVIGRRTWFYTTFGTFFMVFGLCALLLAAAGLYGVMSFAVSQRTREMGVRSAFGAQGSQLIALVMRRSVVQLVVGLALGLVIALSASGALQPVLYGVDPRDAVVFAAVVLVLAVVSLLASFLPARRVTRIDPVTALGNP